ncbi:hypothetical protein COT12_01985 [Candidatus Berkelbacteria bacterium CG08_land_8_20_14_0_20_39_8]|uniref:Nucleotidyl transferase domain-containing protein n=1 Tax=Candidatus Berkelbacteria bacterium CG08_land_8_20_14_0_20_39_8 TaxID=1974511 RepID=A0A2M6YC31_9BACT|nr:MAG: hypothetical protein COT12_01985 [Candidatus Berkelbacteria bacterium CG08_land_8_20_14_0_20_39_8]
MERKRITISIQEDLLKKLDQSIDGVKMRNRSHAIEFFLSESLNVAKIETAIIMAGGKGALRLIPAIENSIELLKNYGVTNIIIAIGYLGEKVKQNIGNGKKNNLNISYIEGGEGTAGALSLLKDKIKNTFIVVNLDEIMNINFEELVNFHLSHKPLSTIATENTKNLKGYYVFEPEIFALISEGFSMLEEDIFPKLMKNNDLLFFPIFRSELTSE